MHAAGREVHLEGAVLGSGDKHARVSRPSNLVHRADVAAKRGCERSLHTVPQLDALVEGRAYQPAAVRGELYLHTAYPNTPVNHLICASFLDAAAYGEKGSATHCAAERNCMQRIPWSVGNCGVTM